MSSAEALNTPDARESISMAGEQVEDSSSHSMDENSHPTTVDEGSELSSDEESDVDVRMDYEEMLAFEDDREMQKLERYHQRIEYQYDGKLLLVVREDGTKHLRGPDVELESHFWRGYEGLPISLYSDDGRIRDKQPGHADLDYRVPNEHYRYLLPFERDSGYEDAFLADIHQQLIAILQKAGWSLIDIEKFMYYRFPTIVDKKASDGPCGRSSCAGRRCQHDEQFLQFHWSSQRNVPDLRSVPLYFKKLKLLFLGHGAMVEAGYASIIVLGFWLQTSDIIAVFDALQRCVEDKGTLLEAWERQIVIDGLVSSRKQLQIPIRLKSGATVQCGPNFTLPFRFRNRMYKFYFEYPVYEP